jgi:4-diphosphocytidyl-2-C-methyl-D-erythritol kinase
VLRLATDDFDPEELARIAAGLGADVPSQLAPRFALVGGAGERVTPLPDPDPFWVVLVPDREGLSTAAVYAEADRLGVGRSGEELERLRGDLLGLAAAGDSPLAYADGLENDLAAAALSLRPSIGEAIAALEEAGAEPARVTGSGPTAFGLFRDRAAAEDAAARLGPRREAIVSASGMMR